MTNVELRNASSTLLFNFLPEPIWSMNIGMQKDYDDIPYQRKPDAYDPINQNLTITINGTLTPLASALTVSGTNESLRERMNILRGLTIYQTDGTLDESNITEILYKLRLHFPDSLGYDSQDYQDFDVVITGMTFDATQLPLNLGYSVSFREVGTLTLT